MRPENACQWLINVDPPSATLPGIPCRNQCTYNGTTNYTLFTHIGQVTQQGDFENAIIKSIDMFKGILF